MAESDLIITGPAVVQRSLIDAWVSGEKNIVKGLLHLPACGDCFAGEERRVAAVLSAVPGF